MNRNIFVQLWVVKFCIKVLYPKYNLYIFLVYLAVRYRILLRRQNRLNRKISPLDFKIMYKMYSVPTSFQRKLVRKFHEDIDQGTYSNVVVVPAEEYNRLVSENPFYYDHGSLWATISLAPESRDIFEKQISSKREMLIWDLGKPIGTIFHNAYLENHKILDNRRIVRLVSSDVIANDVIVVSQDEDYNIKFNYHIPFEDLGVLIQLNPIFSMDHIPQIAASAVVQMVVNPFDLSNDFVKELLNNYFRSPRLMHIDDIFSIELTIEMTTKYHYKYSDLTESTPYVYFRCCKINDRDKKNDIKDKGNVTMAYFIVKGKTELNLGENIHIKTPALKYLTSTNTELIDCCPLGLKDTFKKMQDAVYPFLVPKGTVLLAELNIPIMPIFLLSGRSGSGRHALVRNLARYNGVNCLVVDCNGIQSSTAKQTESKITNLIQRAKSCSPVIVLMDNFEVFGVDAENNEDCRILEYFRYNLANLFEFYTKIPIIFIAVSERQELKSNIMRLFLDKFEVEKLTSDDRYAMLKWYVAAMKLEFVESEKNSSISYINYSTLEREEYVDDKVKEILRRMAAKTETFSYGDLDSLVHFALKNSYTSHCKDLTQGTNQTAPNIRRIQEDDFCKALEHMRFLQSQHMDAPKIPKVFWKDIGGLDSLKKELLKTIELPIKYPHLFKNSTLKRSGVLLYGPPGCGKTLIAKALCTELNLSFLSVKGPELLNMYIGQSEENVRKVFESARAAAPCVVFLDELDALAPRRGAAGDSGGASDRVVSQLLAEIDGVTDAADGEAGLVFVMGATNRPDLLEPSLLRPGRLDRAVYVGPYCGDEQKTNVLAALCHKHKLSPGVELSSVSGALPARVTGADLLQVVKVARAAAVRKCVANLRKGASTLQMTSDHVQLDVEDFLAGVEAFKPSTTDEEFAYYEGLRAQL